MKSIRAHACLLTAALLLGACTAREEAPHVALRAGDAVSFEQSFVLTERSAGGEELPSLRVDQDVTLTCRAVSAAGADVAVAYGRVRVWVGELEGAPRLDTLEHGADTADRVFRRAEVELGDALAALWLTMPEITLTATLRPDGTLGDIEGAEAIARRLDGGLAEDLGGALLEGAVANPAMLLAPRVRDGTAYVALPTPWFGRVLELAGPLATEAGATTFRATETRWSAGTGATPPAELVEATLAGAYRLDAADGLPQELGWDAAVAIEQPADDGTATRGSARLVARLRRLVR